MSPRVAHRCFGLLCWFSVFAYTGSQCAAETIKPSEFVVAEGFEVSLWATTPQLFNPTNFDIDGKGRIWATEAVNYRNYRNADIGLENEAGDRVVVLEDTNADGKADSSHTFVRDKDLVAPLGIAVIGNKVVVSCAPNLLVYTDVDGDAVFTPGVDTKEVLLTGFGSLDHDHSLHSVTVGPDGYWYFNAGNGGPHTVTDRSGWTLRAGSSYAGGSPHLNENFPGRKSDDGRVWVGGLAMRMRPDGTGLEPVGHNFRNVYEESLSSFGDVFQADNDDPPACRTTWLMEYGNLGFSSADGSRKWQVDQRPGQPTRIAEWRQEDPGTIPAGDVYGFGAPTGVAFCENGCFDSRYPDGLLLVCESARGEVFGYVPKPQGAGFSLTRSVFLQLKKVSPSSGMFRPSDAAVGPDGAIYVSDWFDAGVGGHRMSDRTGSGSIYRIAPREFKPEIPAINLSTAKGQIAALKSPAVHVRAVAFEKLKKNASEASSEIIQLSKDGSKWFAARATWLLPWCGKPGLQRLIELAEHGTASMRVVVLRSLRRAAAEQTPDHLIVAAYHKVLKRACHDQSSAVRREAAITLRDVPLEQCSQELVSLANGFDGWDRWYLEALGTACEGKEEGAYELLVGKAANDGRSWDRRLAGIAWRLHPVTAVQALKARAVAPNRTLEERKQMVDALAFIHDVEAAKAMFAISVDGPKDIQPLAAWWGNHRLANDWSDLGFKEKFPKPPKPEAKTKTRLETRFLPAGQPLFQAKGEHAEIDIDVRGVQRLYLVVDSNGRRMHDAVWRNAALQTKQGEIALGSLPWAVAFSAAPPSGPAVQDEPQSSKKKAGQSRPPLTRKPLVNVEEDGSSAIWTTGQAVIAYDVGELACERFKAEVSAPAKTNDEFTFSIYVDRTAVGDAIPSVPELEEVAKSASLGRAVFFSSRVGCSKCHAVAGYGGEIGPDLTHVGRKHSFAALREDILMPHKAIATGFETMSVLTGEGKVISGLQVSAGDPVVLKDVNGVVHAVKRDDIDEIVSSPVSLMPELGKLLTAEELASLLAFLQETAAAAE